MNTAAADPGKSGAWLGYAGLLLILLATVASGYAGFLIFAANPKISSANLYLFAMFAGVASFFSPCAFPLLPSYLSFYQGTTDGGERPRPGAGRALRHGSSAALGVMVFALILGVIIALLGAGVAQGLSISGPEPNRFVRIFRAAVGAALLALGVAQLLRWSLKPRVIDAFAFHTRPQRVGGRSPATALFLYGLGYNAAGMGCTAPILAGLMIVAATSGGFTSALGAFLVFAVTMGALMLVVSLLVAAAEETRITGLKAATSKVRLASSFVLILVGIFYIYSAFNLPLFVALFFPGA